MQIINLSEVSALLHPSAVELPWMMQESDKAVLSQVLRASRPVVALEIGTSQGGSLRHIAAHARRTYSIDIDPKVRMRLEPLMPNVRFLTGNSATLVPTVLAECQAAGEPINFILVDGDHTCEGVRADLNAILAYRPVAPLWILMHDSSNPDCRRGIATAEWAGNPHVHLVEIDFVTGTLMGEGAFNGQIWGGLALALLLPDVRTHPLVVGASLSRHHRALLHGSTHRRTPANLLRLWLHNKWRGLRRRLQQLRAP